MERAHVNPSPAFIPWTVGGIKLRYLLISVVQLLASHLSVLRVSVVNSRCPGFCLSFAPLRLCVRFFCLLVAAWPRYEICGS
jgi:hypothetical protein